MNTLGAPPDTEPAWSVVTLAERLHVRPIAVYDAVIAHIRGDLKQPISWAEDHGLDLRERSPANRTGVTTMDQTAAPIALTTEDIAENLRWRLSNVSDDSFEQGDVAYDADRDGTTITLHVSLFNFETRQRGEQRFALTVTPLTD